MSTGEILLVAVAILIPLIIAVVVTLWTLQPAVLRAERSKRSRKRRDTLSPAGETAEETTEPQKSPEAHRGPID